LEGMVLKRVWGAVQRLENAMKTQCSKTTLSFLGKGE